MGIGKRLAKAIREDGGLDALRKRAAEGKRREAPYRPDPNAKPVLDKRPPANW